MAQAARAKIIARKKEVRLRCMDDPFLYYG
jgi:hypothetical protein